MERPPPPVKVPSPQRRREHGEGLVEETTRVRPVPQPGDGGTAGAVQDDADVGTLDE